MRVLMFGWEFPPHITGGLGTACYGLTHGLAENDVKVIMVIPKTFGGESDSDVRVIDASSISVDSRIVENLQPQIIKLDSPIVPYVTPEEFARGVRLHSQFNGGTYNFSGKYGANLIEEVERYAVVAMQLARDISDQFDIIHAHDWLTYQAGILVKQISGKPLVVHVHATEFDRSGANVNPQVFRIEQMGMKAADRVVTVSNLTKSIVVDKYGIAPEKVVVVHNAVIPENRNIVVERDLDMQTVTYLGRITYQKGPDYFIDAAAKVLKRVDNVKFVMAGSGDLYLRSVRRVAALGLSDRFHFPGFLKGDEVRRMLARSDVYVMPSVSEPFGISPLEAMRENVPVIISKQSGVAEILKHAIKVDFWDTDAIADAIFGLLKYRPAARIVVENGRREVDSLRWNDAARNLVEIYRNLYAKKFSRL